TCPTPSVPAAPDTFSSTMTGCPSGARHRLGGDARDRVQRSARRERHHHHDRPRRIGLRPRNPGLRSTVDVPRVSLVGAVLDRGVWGAVQAHVCLLLTVPLSDVRCGCAPWKGGALQWVQVPPGNAPAGSSAGDYISIANGGNETQPSWLPVTKANAFRL